jgi:hypothetical protein
VIEVGMIDRLLCLCFVLFSRLAVNAPTGGDG